MAMPTWEDASLPLLKVLADGKPRTYNELVAILSDQFHLTPNERAERIPSGKLRIYDRAYWASHSLVVSGLASRPQRGIITIAPSGRDLLASAPEKITHKFLLANFPSYADFVEHSRGGDKQRAPRTDDAALTPAEEVDRAIADLTGDLENRLLERLKEGSWQFFQSAVIKVLAKMGYGWDEDAAKVGRAGPDGGVDGEIRQDALGLEMIYVQAKRYTKNNVPVPDIDRFVGALNRKQSRKGVFITTADFSSDALSLTPPEGKRVVLINGAQFVKLMIQYGVGVIEKPSPKIYDVDENFFSDEVDT